MARKSYGVYAMGFSLIAVMNHKLAEFNKYEGKIPIITDSGKPKKGQVVKAHSFMQERLQGISDFPPGRL